MNRNVPKIEWAIELDAQARPVPVRTAVPIPLRDLPGLTPLDVAPLEKAGITTVGELEDLGANSDLIAALCAIDGIGEKRARKISDACDKVLEADPVAAEGWRRTTEAAHAALDRAAEFSHGQLVLSTGYPRFLTLDDKTYIVIRWGGCALHQQFYMRLKKADPRFHKCPPLSNADTGMAECLK